MSIRTSTYMHANMFEMMSIHKNVHIVRTTGDSGIDTNDSEPSFGDTDEPSSHAA